MNKDNKRNCRHCNKQLTENSIMYSPWLPYSREDNPVFWFCNDKCLEDYRGSEKERTDDIERLKKIEQYIKETGDKDAFINTSKEEVQKIRDKWNKKPEKAQPVAQPVKTTKASKPQPKEQGSNKTAIYWIVGILVLAIVGGVGWFIWQGKKRNQEKEDEQI